MVPFRIIQSFLHQATEQGSRSTVLKPLGWMMSILVAATIAAFYFSTPAWVGGLFAIFAACTMALYLFAYVYCIFKDRDALRSETYSIQKLAIEKGFVGDSLQGVIELQEGVVRSLAKTSEPSSGPPSEGNE